MNAKNTERVRGGLYGMLVGDALGVPYEFRSAHELPPLSGIEMDPPLGFRRTYAKVPAGTWSDDGSMALCLLESLLECGGLDTEDLAAKFADWLANARNTPDGVVFDVGGQTHDAIAMYTRGTPPEECGFVRPDGKGNGALMRVLPLALWHDGSDEALAELAHRQSKVTHGHVCNQVCCAYYCLLAKRLLNGADAPRARVEAHSALEAIYQSCPAQYADELAKLELCGEQHGTGTGYVVDCLKSALMVIESSESYEEAAKRAVALGNDTDTTACVTCGLAGIIYGEAAIPKRWKDALNGKRLIEDMLERLGCPII